MSACRCVSVCMLLVCALGVFEVCLFFLSFFFQAEDGIRDLVRSRGLGDVYKRQALNGRVWFIADVGVFPISWLRWYDWLWQGCCIRSLSLIHI